MSSLNSVRSPGARARRVLALGRLVLILLVAWPAHVSAEGRVALVIGNGAYETLERLKNPVNDAKLMTRALRSAKFEVVEHMDADERTMKRAIQEFGRRIAGTGRDTVSIFYYAGHGLQVNGLNYLVPTKARIQREGDVEIEAVDAGMALRQMEDAGSRVNIVILDACRNNPLPRGLRSVSRGLATVNAPQGSLIAYSTAPGSVSVDGEGQNSPYTQALAAALREPGLTAEEVFRQVRVRVLKATRGQQVPWETSSLTGAFYFSPTSAVAGNPAGPVVALAPPPSDALSGGPSRAPGTMAPDPRPAPPAPPAPPALPKGDIVGRWQGRYQCQQQEVGFSLDVTSVEGDRISAVFEFFPLPGTLSIPRGSFRMAGDYNRADGSFRLEAGDWIKRVLGFQRHDIEGQVADNGVALNGRVLTTGCAHFVLTRR
ncbi:MAG TPA: caspase family protein [Methylomirabilota bacterium]